jgi:hypothetical protein
MDVSTEIIASGSTLIETLNVYCVTVMKSKCSTLHYKDGESITKIIKEAEHFMDKINKNWRNALTNN